MRGTLTIAAGRVLALLVLVVGWGARPAAAEPGLLLIAHGSRSAAWNQALVDFGQRVSEEVRKTGQYRSVRTAMLEAAPPQISTALAELEGEGCDRIVAVPLFIAPTGHTHFDVPAALGIFFSPRTVAALEEEGLRPARPKVPVVMTPTLAESDVLAQFVTDETRKLSRGPEDEALVILTHGDPDHALLVERLMRRIATQACGATGIRYADWASVAMGQEYRTRGLPAIEEALRHKRRVLVVGVYVATSAAALHQRAMAHGPRSNEPRPGEVVFSEATLVTHPALVRWVVQSARAALGPGGAGGPSAGQPAPGALLRPGTAR